MANGQTGLVRQLTTEVSPDGLQAWVKIGRGGVVPTATDIIDTLTEARIVVDDKVRSRLDALLAALTRGEELPERFLIAEGRAPVEGQDGSFVWDARFRETDANRQAGAPVNYYKKSNIAITDSSVVIGKIVPATPGKEGVDVRGTRLALGRRPAEVQLGKGVERFPHDPSLVLSKVAGRVSYQDGILSVTEALDIKGDVDFSTGSIDSPVEVRIGGSIRDKFEVKSNKSITVGGCIEEATVFAQGDVVVRNGILGRGKGVVTVGGQCVAKFCQGATLISTGDVRIAKEVMHSSVYTDGKLCVDRGSVIGGSTYAREGVEAAELGNPSGIATEVIVGTHPSVLAKVRSMDIEVSDKKRVLDKIEGAVRSVMPNLKRLTPQQKGQVTELVAKAKSLRQAVAEAEKTRDSMLAQASPRNAPAVLVSKIVHENVRIRIGAFETRFDKEMKGPLRIELRKVDNATELVAANQLTGSITVLPTLTVGTDPVDAA